MRLRRNLRVLIERQRVVARKQRHGQQLLHADQTRAHAVVDIMGVVRNLVGQIAQLGFERRLLAAQKTLGNAAGLALLYALGVGVRAVLENAFACLESEIQAVEAGVTLFEPVDHAQALQVVLEAAPLAHAFIERILARVAERRMTQVVRQADGFNQVFVEPQRARDRTAQLRDFERMREPRAKQIALVVQEHLGLVDQPAKRRRVHDTIAVALVIGTRGRGRLLVQPATRVRGPAGPAREACRMRVHGLVVAQRQQASITSRTSLSGAERTMALPGSAISTKRISPPSAFLSTRICCR